MSVLIPAKAAFDWAKLVVWGVLLALFVLLGAWGWYNSVQVGVLEEKLKAMDLQKAALAADNESLTLALSEQNKYVQTLLDASQKASEWADSEITRVKRKAAKWEAQYRELLTAQPPGDTECAQTEAVLNGYIDLRLTEAAP